MRSKEVEEAINTLEAYKKAFIFPTDITENDYSQSVKTVLFYIEELENYMKRLDELNERDFIFKDNIRDKIKEIEEQAKKGYTIDIRQLDILKELLDEEKEDV